MIINGIDAVLCASSVASLLGDDYYSYIWKEEEIRMLPVVSMAAQ